MAKSRGMTEEKQKKERARKGKRHKFQLQREMIQNVLLTIVVTQKPQSGLAVKIVKDGGIVCAR